MKLDKFDGEQPPNRVVIVKWPSMEAFKTFEDREAGKKARDEASKKYTEWKALWVVEGVEQK